MLPVAGAANDTVTPATALPKASEAATTNGAASAVPTVPLWPVPETVASLDAAAGPTVELCVAVTAGRAAMAAVTVRAPAVTRFTVALAVPRTSDVAVAVKAGSVE